MIIEFLGHAGFMVQTQGQVILLDPWLQASSLQEPIINSLAGGHRSIDYLLPEPVRKVDEIQPDIILLSHLHAHHSPTKEIESWLSSATKKIKVVFPLDAKKPDEVILKGLRQKYSQHEFVVVTQDFQFQSSEIQISCLTHPMKDHLGYFIRANETSFLHLADAIVSTNWWDRRLDPMWMKFKDLNPTFMASTVNFTTSKSVNQAGEKFIKENGFLSPPEAARLTQLINPQIVSVMGIFNFSVYKNRFEYSFPPYESEAYFDWCVRALSDQIQVLTLRPGTVLNLKDLRFSFFNKQT